jgi:hypothetical protein
MTTREILNNRIAASARTMERQHLSEWCDVYSNASHTRDNAGAPKSSNRPRLESVRCGVAVEDEPSEVVVNGQVIGLADAMVYLPVGTDVRNTDEIHVRANRLAEFPGGHPNHEDEHRVYNVVYVQRDATHRHLLTVKVVRRK